MEKERYTIIAFMFKKYLPHLNFRSFLVILLGNIILAFGLYNIHAQTDITEGGVLGLMLLLKYWFDISPAYSGFVLDVLCYGLGWKVLGKDFLGYSVVATVFFSVSYRIFEKFPPLWPALSLHPAAAAVAGACFIGVGAGLSVRAGGATGGDDAIAMALSHLFHAGIQWMYLFTDLTVLLLSLTYIPLSKLIWSFVTVTISGQIIGWIQKIPSRKTSV